MRRAKGFTLIELLVVIASIALLLGILVPTLQRARNRARAVVCQSNLHQWSLVFSMYDKDYEGRFCAGCREYKTNDQRHWAMALRPYYYHDRQITLCPSAIKPYDEGGKIPYGAWRGPDDFLFSYGLNGWVYNAKESNEMVNFPIERFWGELNIKGAENIPLFLDCRRAEGFPSTISVPPEKGEYAMVGWDLPVDWGRFCLNRHSGAVNCLFMDSSVRKVGLKELWTLKWHREFNTAGRWTKARGVRPEDWPEWMRSFKDY
ncbi:MAG: prepilin-type N-terminal cleavage/methylation domain-containing protein [Planctomycetota bacterium]|jgi:prepilin-type N-terminal cleavage/methylation domain-containing protein/prepilin-type processing-associated H-X9-DG protein